MRITRTRQIDAPAHEVWRVVGPGFADVGTWASEVLHSVPVRSAAPRGAALRGAPCDGRACSVATPGFDAVREDLLDYDDERMSLTYRAGSGMPRVVREARNTWSVAPLAPGRCVASMTAEVELAGAGRLAGPVLVYLTHRLGRRTLADLDHHVTTGRPSPRRRRSERRRETGPLGRVVRANAAFSWVTGLALVAGAPVWVAHLGAPPAWVPAAVGTGLLVFAAVLVLLGRTRVAPHSARVLAALDVGWVVGSGALLAAAGRSFSTGGWLAVAATSSVVATFGALQWWHSRAGVPRPPAARRTPRRVAAGAVVTDRSATPN
ncbi:SRPBCC family protein [Actinotalea sp. AC32]|nr:SRPBCC family protein [Actinotalea sp. AC32]